jgi:hypothetical protein
VPHKPSSGPIYAACGERTNTAWLTVLEPPRALPTAMPLGLGKWRLDGRGSRDPDGNIREYRWSIPGQDPASSKKPDVELPSGRNSVTATLRVTDDDGLADDRDVRLRSSSRILASSRFAKAMLAAAPLQDVRRLTGAGREGGPIGPSGVVAASVLGTPGVASP